MGVEVRSNLRNQSRSLVGLNLVCVVISLNCFLTFAGLSFIRSFGSLKGPLTRVCSGGEKEV